MKSHRVMVFFGHAKQQAENPSGSEGRATSESCFRPMASDVACAASELNTGAVQQRRLGPRDMWFPYHVWLGLMIMTPDRTSGRGNSQPLNWTWKSILSLRSERSSGSFFLHRRNPDSLDWVVCNSWIRYQSMWCIYIILCGVFILLLACVTAGLGLGYCVYLYHILLGKEW